MRGYAHSEDLEPGVQYSRAMDCQTSGNTCTPTSPPTHPHILTTMCLLRPLQLPWNPAGTLSTSGTMRSQQIRAHHRTDHPQYYQNHPSGLQDSHSACGNLGVIQTIPSSRTSPGKSPLPCMTMPNVARRVARSWSGHARNGQRGLIARSRGPQNRLGV